MRKKIWASLDDYPPSHIEPKLYGRGFGNYNFFRALLKYGHFDEYHFFLHNESHKRLFEETHGPYLQAISANSNIRLFSRTEMMKAVRQYDYTVFHQADHIRYFNSLCYFRNHFGLFPVTSFIHSLSHPSLNLKHHEMLLGGVTPGDSIICSSSAGREVLQKYFEQLSRRLGLPPPPVLLEVIPFGLEGSQFTGLNCREARESLGFSPNEVIGLCFGRFSEYDKMDLFPLLQAFQKIYRKGVPWRLILAGAAQSQDYLKILELWAQVLDIREAIVLKTDPSETEKIALYRAANFFVSPSDNPQETFGLTLLEAMAAQLPLIVSDFDGYKDIATPDVALKIPTRWSHLNLFDSKGVAPLLDEQLLARFIAQSISVDIDRLAAALQTFYSQAGLCEEMGKKARKRFDEHFEYRVIINRLENFWIKLKEKFSPEFIKPQVNALFPDIFQAFSHYLTETITLKTRIKRTEFASQFLQIGANYPILVDMEQIVEREITRQILLSINEPKSIEEVIGHIGIEEERVHYQVLWLLKHGMLELC